MRADNFRRMALALDGATEGAHVGTLISESTIASDPGVPPERNLKGISFAVANATGLLALALEGLSSSDALASRLVAFPIGQVSEP